ncbi:MAG TPA: YCF48-related protein [Candidatus Solibacter sp.]|nr:YCF48-related protein [Candidatus Solibacter sp.]
MPDISNSVRQRLGARPAPPTHPDADTLTAYVEQVLSAGERSQIVEHLAACAFCRDIVALSLPELPEKALIQTLPAPSRFWTFGLRWAGGIAVVAIAVTLVIERPGDKSPAPYPVSTLEKTAHTDSTSAQRAAEPVRPETTGSAMTSSDASSAGASRTSSASRSAGAAGSTAAFVPRADRQSPASPVPSEALSNVDAAHNEVAIVNDKDSARFASNAVSGLVESYNSAKPVPVQSNRGFVNSNIFLAEERSGPSNYSASYNYALQEQAKADNDRAMKEQMVLAHAGQSPELDANSRKGFLRTAIPKINPTRLGPLAANALSAVKSATTGSSAAPDALTERAGAASSFAPSPARPAISPKSVAGLASTITHDSTDARRAKTAGSEQLHWRVQDGKLVNSADQSQWHEAYPEGDDIQFKVVQAQGHDVWAGGTNGTLVHSWDGGVDWQKLSLGDAASGDIEKISLSGGDVQVKTSNGQHLISRDGGKTWMPLNSQSTPAQPK